MSAEKVAAFRRQQVGVVLVAALLAIGFRWFAENNARRFDALAAEGVDAPGVLTVQDPTTGLALDSNRTHVVYVVDGMGYLFGLDPATLSGAAGTPTTLRVHPDSPLEPWYPAGAEASLARAGSIRQFSGRIALGVFLAGLALAALIQMDVRRAQRGETGPAVISAEDVRRRKRTVGGAMLGIGVLVVGAHSWQMLAQGEAIGVVIGVGATTLLVLGGVLFTTFRQVDATVGLSTADAQIVHRNRMSRIVPWVIGLAVLRMLIELFVS